MKIIILSDTHGNRKTMVNLLDQVVENFPPDLLIHLGDGYEDAILAESFLAVPMLAVRGNCDIYSTFPDEIDTVIEGKKFLICHGDSFRVKNGFSMLHQKAEKIGAEAVLYGHNHIASITRNEGILYMNPGAFVRLASKPSLGTIEIIDGLIMPKLVEASKQSLQAL